MDEFRCYREELTGKDWHKNCIKYKREGNEESKNKRKISSKIPSLPSFFPAFLCVFYTRKKGNP